MSPLTSAKPGRVRRKSGPTLPDAELGVGEGFAGRSDVACFEPSEVTGDGG